MNNKTEKSYDIVLNKLYSIIFQDNNLNLKIITITSDFEIPLINIKHKIYLKIVDVSDVHFIKNIRLNMLKLGLP